MNCRLSIVDCRLDATPTPRRSIFNRQSTIDNRQSVFLVALLFSMVGCTAPRRTFQPDRDPSQPNDAVFLHYLAAVPTVTVDEGLRAMLILSTPEGDFPTFDDRLAELTRRGAVKVRWRLEPDQTLDHGTLAHLLTVLCGTPSSLCEAFTRPSGLGDRRYALKTCIDEGLLPYALPHEPVSGGEFVAVLSRAEARIQVPNAGVGP